MNRAASTAPHRPSVAGLARRPDAAAIIDF